MPSLSNLLSQIVTCQICSEHLPLGPRPVLQIDPQALILIAGQAPGKRVHESGVPFDDPSGNRLRDWMGVTRETFYNSKKIAILPMGFCYPGTGKSGDLPPRPECEPAWREQLLEHLGELRMTLVLGKYAQDYHLDSSKTTLTDRVKAWRDTWPKVTPLPHPSPRNNRWLKQNPWFEAELIPVLQQEVSEILNS